MPDIHYEEYHNPYPDGIPWETLDVLLDADSKITSEYETTQGMPLTEFVLRAVRSRMDLPQAVRDWEQAADGWIPGPLLEWWLEESDTNLDVDAVSPEWLQTQPLRVIGAWHDNEPVGAVGLTRIGLEERVDNMGAQTLFNEVRGLIVDPRYRNSPARIGTELVRRIVAVASPVSEQPTAGRPLATIAITTSPNAAKTFQAAGAVSNPALAGISMNTTIFRSLACWRQSQGHNSQQATYCHSCPRRDGRLWLWPAGTRRGRRVSSPTVNRSEY